LKDDNLLKRCHALGAHLDAEYGFAGSDEQKVLVFSSEGDVCRPTSRDRDMLDFLSFRIENRDAASGEIDVSFIVDGHAIGSQLAEQSFVGHASVCLDVERVGFASTDVGYVEDLSVRSADQPVGLLEVIGDTDWFHRSFLKEIQVLSVLLHGGIAFPIVAWVQRIGEINASVRADPKVVRAVHELVVIGVQDDRMLFVRRDGPEFILAIGACPEVAVFVKERAVGSSGRFQPVGERSIIGVPSNDAVVGLVGEEDVSMLVCGGAFGEAEAVAELLELRAGSCDWGRILRLCQRQDR